MELKYYINNVEIDEPIGFDDFKTIIKRGEFHGISAESSIKELEFYGIAFDIIKTAYNTDIDTELIFKFEKGTEIEEWVIDLASYGELLSDYCACTVNVGEIGEKTTFNNRIDTDVTILESDLITIDVSAKALSYISSLKLLSDSPVFTGAVGSSAAMQCILPFGLSTISELNNAIEGTDIGVSLSNDYCFKNQTSSTIDIKYNGLAKFAINPTVASLYTSLKLIVYKIDGTASILSETDIYPLLDPNVYTNYDIAFSGNTTLNVNGIIGVYVYGLSTKSPSEDYSIKMLSNSYINISSVSNEYLSDVTTDTILIDSAINRVVSEISDIPYISDWYKNDNVIPSFGGGALKSLTKGFWLRNAVKYDTDKYQLSISFKTLFRSLNAIDNLGFGFSKEPITLSEQINLTTEYQSLQSDIQFTTDITDVLSIGDILTHIDGNYIGFTAYIVSFPDEFTARFDGDVSEFYADGVIANITHYYEGLGDYLRVERWNWFYNSDVLLTINNPAKKQRSFMPEMLYTRLICGYKKFAGAEDLNGKETFHTEYKYTTNIKAIDNELNVVSDFIADPFLIEFTRQKAFDKTSDDWKFDENIFILQLQYNGGYQVDSMVYDVFDTMTDLQPFNSLITPARNAIRHSERFTKDLTYINSGYNDTAKIKKYDIDDDGNAEIPYYNIEDSAPTLNGLSENENINVGGQLLRPELLSFEYPICKADFQTIKENPYGRIIVDGETCFIKEIIRTPLTGLCELKLIPLYNE